MKLFLFLLLCLGFAQESHSQNSDWTKPAPCHCQGAYKDYDSAKGFYFDRRTWFPVPRVSGRFSCNYFCADSQGNVSRVSYINDESHIGWTKGGPAHAKYFICKYSIGKFIPVNDLMGRVQYYETEPYGEFDPKTVDQAELRQFADENCK